MNTKRYIWIVLFVFCYSIVQAQVIKSEKVSIRLGPETDKGLSEELDQTPPEIKIMSPQIAEGTKYIHKSDLPEINLFGKATGNNGIISVIVNSEMREINDEGVFSAQLSLKPGDNEVTIIAMDNNNNYIENKIIIEYVPLVLSLADKVEQESKYYGLIIGIDNYEDPSIQNLDNPIKDAENLYNILITKYMFEEKNVKLIKDPRREDIINCLDKLSQEITPQDNLLIFYAGHGWWDEEANIGYWLPSNAKRNSKAAWFRNSTLVDYLKEVNCRHTLLITDACFGGAIFKTRSAFNDAPKAIERLYELPSRKAMTSGTLTEVPDRSAFVRYLINRLSNNLEKYLSAEQLFTSFRIPVINNSDVVPQFGEIKDVGDEGGDFIFILREIP